ncbi:MAG: squalene synthase HpnC [Actinomycetota bacterium]|nr:squalene synthase HpnC [Actinomycetota bacterium]
MSHSQMLNAGTRSVPVTVPDLAAVDARAASENFVVATRWLPGRVRRDLVALYGYARLVDELGDAASGDRSAWLDWAEAELDAAFAGRATHPVFARLGATVGRGLDRQPFLDLIEANRLDQRVRRYETFDDLLGYCRLSANPVGRMVLGVLGLDDPGRVARSDAVCTALQLVEHWQDVAEDARAGRVYLPADDLERFGVAAEELTSTPASPGLRALVCFECDRARRLLAEGAPLVTTVPGTARLALAGFVGGGAAALRAVAAARFDVTAGAPRAAPSARARATLWALSGRVR